MFKNFAFKLIFKYIFIYYNIIYLLFIFSLSVQSLNDLDKVVPNSANNPISEYALYGNFPIARITNPRKGNDVITIKGIENDLVVYDVNEFHDLRIKQEMLSWPDPFTSPQLSSCNI